MSKELNAPDIEPETVTTKVASKLFGMSEGLLRHMCLTRKIPGAKKVGKYWFVQLCVLKKIYIGEK